MRYYVIKIFFKFFS